MVLPAPRHPPQPTTVRNQDAIMDLLAHRETPVQLDSNTQLLITPALDGTGTININPVQPTHPPRNALLPIPPPQALHKDRVLQATRHPRRHSRPSHNYGQGEPSAIHIRHGQRRYPYRHEHMRSYAIDTLFASEYYTGDTEKIETTDTLKALDSAQFTIAIQNEITSLIHQTKTFISVTRTLHYRENTTNKRVWHNSQVQAEKETQRRARQAQSPRRNPRGHTPPRHDQSHRRPPDQLQPHHYATHLRTLPATRYIQKLHMATMDIKSAYLNAPLPPDADWIVTTLEPHIARPKLLTKLFALYPSLKDSKHKPIHPYPPLPKDSDPSPQPTDHYGYLCLLGILLYLTKSRPDIMAAVSFAGIKSSNPTDRDHSNLYDVVEYLRATQDIGHILHKSSTATLRLYCEVDAFYLLHWDSKGHTTGYTISLHGTTGTFYNRSVKQTAVVISSVNRT
eukprot:gene27600-biopygen22715